jgi:NAD(P) transhydrogenase subunit alpha
MEDDVIRGATVTYQGEITFPPPPPKVQAIAAKPKENRRGRADAGGEARAGVAAFKKQTRSR